jgi:hypothetical protein
VPESLAANVPDGDADQDPYIERDNAMCGGPMARLRYGLRSVSSNDKEKAVKIRSFVAAGALLASSAAFAFHCPADMKKIDEALAKNPKLTAEQMSEVKKLRAEGEASHKAGRHQESVDTLAKAMKILGV